MLQPMKHLLIVILLFFMLPALHAQRSVHQQQSEAWAELGALTDAQYDSINHFEAFPTEKRSAAPLQKRVFGYHPYWGGSAWQNYRWELLSDLCYFSYEVDPATGNALTTRNWETAPVIDTALAHGVRVHLCVTLFSGHATFFGNPQARQTLTGNLISMILSRGAHGINLDFEAVPSSQQQGLTNYITELSQALHAAIPEAELSIAAPAVNWNNTFDLPAITPWLDLVMIMAYDYYWDGSSIAGPVSGLWPLTSSFNYGVNRSLTYYQSAGVPVEKLLLGLPYYGREWPVTANTLPANTTGSGTAIVYRNIRANSSGNYNPANLYWDYRSFNPYYSYFTGQWRQCFFDDVRSLGAKYDLVNRRGAGGIGIWALGYDNGYPELWDLIEEKFTQPAFSLCSDTVYDSGGPWWSYGASEAYTETIQSAWPGPLTLTFENLSLESDFDSLWIYDGNSTAAPLLAALSGGEVPPALHTNGNSFTLRLQTDGLNQRAGYALVWHCPTAGTGSVTESGDISLYPNPAVEEISLSAPKLYEVSLLSAEGRLLQRIKMRGLTDRMDVSRLKPGIYLLQFSDGKTSISRRFVKL